MDKRPARTGAVTLALLLAVTASLALGTDGPLTASHVSDHSGSAASQPMDACGRNDAFFRSDDGDKDTNVVQAWSDYYHATVADLLDQHLDPEAERLECVDDPHYEASEALTEIAIQMEPWKSGAPLTERDMPAVLLSFLRAYECALEERKQDLYYYVASDAVDDAEHFFYDPDEGGVDTEDGASMTSVIDETAKEIVLIAREQQESRPALRRTLQYFSGRDRLRPLEQNLQCLERVSLEIRNILSLAADSASCMPRIWGSRDPVRDL